MELYDKSALKKRSAQELMRDLAWGNGLLIAATFFAFLASSVFIVKYFAGGSLDIGAWTGEQLINAGIGFGLTASITAAQAWLYQSEYKGTGAVIGIFIVIFFGLFAEVSQTMEREDAVVRHRSENSPVFIAAVNGIKAAATSNPVGAYAADIAEASRKLAQCKSRLAQGKEKHCTGDQAALDALKTQAAAAGQYNQSAITAAVSQAKSLEYDEDKHYAVIRLLKNQLNITSIVASFLFAVIVIGTFEYAFHFIGSYVADHKAALRELGYDPSDKQRVDTQKHANNEEEDYSLPSVKPNDDLLNKAINLIWEKIERREITHITTRDDGGVAMALANAKIGSNNGQRRDIIALVLDALLKEGVLVQNAKYVEGGNNGIKPKYLINKNPSTRYPVPA